MADKIINQSLVTDSSDRIKSPTSSKDVDRFRLVTWLGGLIIEIVVHLLLQWSYIPNIFPMNT